MGETVASTMRHEDAFTPLPKGGSGTCGLCGREAELCDSHLLPSFVFKWLKDTSATGYLRFAENPNRRVQDGLKHKWLCRSCEQLFSREERAFANKIFHPYQQDTGVSAAYSEWLMRFCVSVSWRVLSDCTKRHDLSHLTPVQKGLAAQALERWRSYLLGEVPHPGSFEQHLLPLDALGSSTFQGMPDNINRYLLRHVEMDLPSSNNQAFTFAKLGPLLIFGFIQAPRFRWHGTKVQLRSGAFGPRDYGLPTDLWNYLEARARKNASIYRRMSEAQHDKIEADAFRNTDRFRRSKTFEAMRADERMFGTGAVTRKP
jgi:hypothetical protein